MAYDSIILQTSENGVSTITLNRPARHNAFDDCMIGELLQALDAIEADEASRILVLRGAGNSFCAGADLNWMRRAADYDFEQNRADAMQLAELMKKLDRFEKPVIGLVQGATCGGGVGLVACCDIAIAVDSAEFCLSEVKLGLIPAVIAAYVVASIGESSARRYFLSAEKFNAQQARRLGLVHEVVGNGALENSLQQKIDALLQGGPGAQTAAKALIRRVSQAMVDDELMSETADMIAAIRASDEGREGQDAFLHKRKPDWCGG